jgi:hypothetical protein
MTNEGGGALNFRQQTIPNHCINKSHTCIGHRKNSFSYMLQFKVFVLKFFTVDRYERIATRRVQSVKKKNIKGVKPSTSIFLLTFSTRTIMIGKVCEGRKE